MNNEELSQAIKSIMNTLDIQGKFALNTSKQLRQLADATKRLASATENNLKNKDIDIQDVVDRISKDININRDSINEDRERFIRHQIISTLNN